MKDLLETELQKIVIEIEKDIKRDFFTYGSEILLLLLLSKEDSLLNCLVTIKYEQIRKLIKEIKIQNDNRINTILKLAYDISKKDESEVITDEHILYAVLIDKNNNAYYLLNRFNINCEEMLKTVNEYFDFKENKYLINLTEEVKTNNYKYIGNEDKVNKIIRILNKKNKNNCLIIGESGTGKSAIVEGVASIIDSQIIYKLECGSLISGTRYRGDLEERIENVIERVINSNAILFIDEIHMITGGKCEDSLSIANILKPMLSRNKIKCIGATTIDEYEKYIKKDKALDRRFQIIYIDEPNIKETINILMKTKTRYEDYYNTVYTKTDIINIVNYSLLFKNRYNPDKSIDLFDEIGAYCKNRKITKKDIKYITFENLGININNKINIKDKEIKKMYIDYINGVNNNIIGITNYTKEKELLLQKIFNVKKSIIFDLTDHSSYINLFEIFTHSLINIIKIINYKKTNEIINKILNDGYLKFNGNKIYFNHSIFLICENNFNKIGYIKK